MRLLNSECFNGENKMITKEVMCIACKRRWVAKMQEDIPLNKYDCPYCLYPKGLFYTGDMNVDDTDAIELAPSKER